MPNEVTTFDFPFVVGDHARGDCPIRVVEIDGEPWFVAADVCRALGVVNTARALSPLAGDQKGVHRMNTPGGPQTLLVISESGLYKLTMRSDKAQGPAVSGLGDARCPAEHPEARRVCRWAGEAGDGLASFWAPSAH